MSAPEVLTVLTPQLEIEYLQWNPSASRTAVLVHGWPDAPRTWMSVAGGLAARGWRVLAPALRGFAGTRFRSAQTPRSGQLAALGRDLVDFLDALQIAQPLLVGHDWGARAVSNALGLRPACASHLVMLSVGYGTNDPRQPLSYAQARNYWYHWYMDTPRGEHAVSRDRRAFTRFMWDTWSPAGWYDEADFEATAAAFDNPDWAEIVLHSYRQRWGHAPAYPECAADEARLIPAPLIAAPTLVLHGAADTCNHPDTSAGKEKFFSGRYERRLLDGVGHFPQKEAPQRVLQEILGFLEADA